MEFRKPSEYVVSEIYVKLFVERIKLNFIKANLLFLQEKFLYALHLFLSWLIKIV